MSALFAKSASLPIYGKKATHLLAFLPPQKAGSIPLKTAYSP
jgi:hypothetical protein